jgi:uncharacterized RDD family membrane protein YckC
MRRTNAESPDTFTAKLGFFDRTFAPHTDRLGVSCRVQANALIERTSCGEDEVGSDKSACRHLRMVDDGPTCRPCPLVGPQRCLRLCLPAPGCILYLMKTFSARESAWLQELDGIELAGFWQRAAALLIDGLIVGLIFSILLSTAVTIYVNRHPHSSIAGNLVDAKHKIREQQQAEFGSGSVQEAVKQKLREEGIYLIQGILVPILYFGIGLWQGNGRTPGKRLLKIRVVSLVHTHISFWHAAERALGYGAALAEGGFGFFQFFLHPYRRCVQDRIGETIVVTERSYRRKFPTRLGTPSESEALPQ